MEHCVNALRIERVIGGGMDTDRRVDSAMSSVDDAMQRRLPAAPGLSVPTAVARLCRSRRPIDMFSVRPTALDVIGWADGDIQSIRRRVGDSDDDDAVMRWGRQKHTRAHYRQCGTLAQFVGGGGVPIQPFLLLLPIHQQFKSRAHLVGHHAIEFASSTVFEAVGFVANALEISISDGPSTSAPIAPC